LAHIGASVALQRIVELSLFSSFSSLGYPLINDAGQFVFEGTRKSDGKHGIFGGSNPNTDAIVLENDAGSPHPFKKVVLGGFNNAGQLSFYARNAQASRDEIWRVTDPVPSRFISASSGSPPLTIH